MYSGESEWLFLQISEKKKIIDDDNISYYYLYYNLQWFVIHKLYIIPKI